VLATLNDVLPKARAQGYAVGLFNTTGMDMIEGVFSAAEEAQSPIIVGTAEILLPAFPMEYLFPILLDKAQKASVPVVVHMDHALTTECLEKAIDLGVSSVMYDCSRLPYAENAAKVANLVKKAHARGITVEAELGHVGSGDGTDTGVLTLAEEAARYVEETKVDALAVAIGSAHGIYKFKPHLDLPRLESIAKAVSIPLVLHGGSGLTDEDFRNVTARGISKINIYTEICQAGAVAAHDRYEPGMGLFETFPLVSEAVKKATLYRMSVFGSTGKA